MTWALAASTLSALKAFTANFNSTFGLGFTRGKGEDTYGLSAVSGASGQSSKSEEKTKASTIVSGAEISRVCSPELEAQPKLGGEHQARSGAIPIDPLSHEPLDLGPNEILRLRPSHDNLRCVTYVCAEPNLWPPHKSNLEKNGSIARDDNDESNMVIFHTTDYEVHHDRTPILDPYALP